MELFIESPQRAAERFERERRLLEERRVSVAAQWARAAEEFDERCGTGACAADEGALGARGVNDGGAARDHVDVPTVEAYQAELAYDRRRERRRKVGHATRMVLLVVLIPLAVIGVFFAAYALTYILNGATPEEVAAALADLVERMGEFARQVVQEAWRGGKVLLE